MAILPLITAQSKKIVLEVYEVPEGDRKIIAVRGLSIDIFHRKDSWNALRNYCLQRGGPICTGSIKGDTLTCPWHGYQYEVTIGKFLEDPSVSLESYRVEFRDGQVFVLIPLPTWDAVAISPEDES